MCPKICACELDGSQVSTTADGCLVPKGGADALNDDLRLEVLHGPFDLEGTRLVTSQSSPLRSNSYEKEERNKRYIDGS